MFQKIKNKLKNFMTNKAAFSLVELIVVIAIMAVMAAILAPALLGYVEKSRAQKDDSAMDEVVNAIQLSLADQEIYDEVLEHSVWDNVSCYIDKKDESQFADCKVQLKAANGDKKEQYMFGDEARLLDETVYYAAGNMRGLTITFSPSESGDTYDFANGILNKFVGRKTGILSENPELYNRLRSVIGDKLDTTSQTYRNSDYTIFIRVGSTGGTEAVQQDAIQVWGQFNGTNLAEKDHKYELSSGRVVGSAGANDATNNQTNNENGNVDFSENLIVIKTMTIDGVEYQYEEGMTWDEWVNSKYNTNVAKKMNNDPRIESTTSLSTLRYNEYVTTAYIDVNNCGNLTIIEDYDVSSSHIILPVRYQFVDIYVLTSFDQARDAVGFVVAAGKYVKITVGSNPELCQAPVIKTTSINGTQYQYLDGMTWSGWCNSMYNTCGMTASGWVRNSTMSGISNYLTIHAPMLSFEHDEKLNSKNDITQDMLCDWWSTNMQGNELVYSANYTYDYCTSEMWYTPTLEEIRTEIEYAWCPIHGPIR